MFRILACVPGNLPWFPCISFDTDWEFLKHFLPVSRKDIVGLKAPNTQYVAVDIQRLRNATRDIQFDVFLRIGDGHYTHVFSRTTGLDYKRLAGYLAKGVTQLFIRAEDKTAYEAYISRPAELVFSDPNSPHEKKVAALINMTEQNLAEIFTLVNVGEDTAEKTEKVIHNYVDLLVNQPQSLAMLLKLVAHGNFLYYHSIATAVFSLFLGKATGQFNQRTLEMIGLGGFLHDIGTSELPPGVTEFSDSLTPDQAAMLRDHPKVALSMLEGAANIPQEVRYIVYQHHEEPGGTGYPNSLRSNAIYYPAKLVAVCDGFCGLISQLPGRKALSVPDALIKLNQTRGKYDPELVKLLTSIFSRNVGQKAA